MNALAGAALTILADTSVPTDQNSEWGKAAPTGLFVLLAFVVACVFLFRSMNRHIRKAQTNFGTRPAQPTTQGPLGQSKAAVPVVDDEDAVTAGQTPPRLGTPEDALAVVKAKRQDKIRKAKARVQRDAK